MEQTRHEPGGRPGADFGNAGTELRLLIEALAYRAEEFLHGLGSEGAAKTRPTEHAAGAARRESCPMCAVLAVLRGERSESASPVVEQLAVLIAALRRALADHDSADPHGAPAAAPDPAGHAPEGTTQAAGAEEPASSSAKVQRIDVRRVRGNVVRDGNHPADPSSERSEVQGC